MTLFNDQFTVFPDSDSVSLHCYKCPNPHKQVWDIGYHPSLDRVIKEAEEHNKREHAEIR